MGCKSRLLKGEARKSKTGNETSCSAQSFLGGVLRVMPAKQKKPAFLSGHDAILQKLDALHPSIRSNTRRAEYFGCNRWEVGQRYRRAEPTACTSYPV